MRILRTGAGVVALAFSLLVWWPAVGLAQGGPSDRADWAEAAESWQEKGDWARSREQWLRIIEGDVRDSLTGLAMHRMGVLYYREEKDSLAGAWFSRAIAVRDGVFAQPHNDRAHSRYNLSRTLRYRGMLDSAATVLRQAIGLYAGLSHPDTANLLGAYADLSILGRELQDRQLTLSAATMLLELSDRPAAGLSTRRRYVSYYNGGESFSYFAELERALTAADSAVATARRLDDPAGLADALNLRHIVLDKLDRRPEAEADFGAAITLYETHDPENWRLGLLYANRSSDAYDQGRYGAAEADLRRAMAFDNEAGELAFYYARLAKTLLALNRSEEANNIIQEAFQHPELTDLGLLSTIRLDLLEARGEVRLAVGDRSGALEDYRSIVVLNERLRAELGSEESQQFASDFQREYLDRIVTIALENFLASGEQRWVREAFEASERARAYSLAAARAQSRQDRPRREVLLRARIVRLEREPHRATELAAARLELDRLTASKKHPTETETVSPTRPEALSKYLLERNADLLQFHLTDSAAYVFHLEPGGRLVAYALGSSDTILATTEAWRASIETSAYRLKSLRTDAEQSRLDATFLAAGLRLTRTLLPPALVRPRPPRPRPLIIVPDGPLNFLPFAALPLSSAAPPLDYTALNYLGDRRPLQYAYSATLLLAERRVANSTTALAVAPTFRALPPLPHNRAEVEAISELIDPCHVFLGPAATRQSFLEYAPSAGIIHLSSHGVVNATNPNLSYVAFTQMTDSLQPSELLYYNDLYTLDLPADLVVLSACETNLGQLASGETALSLASAFMAAGAESTLTTLWQVDDAATKELMVDFYRHLAVGGARAEALAAAVHTLRSREEYAHPYFWAGLSLHGEGGPLRTGRASYPNWRGGVLVGVILLGTGAILFGLLRKKHVREDQT